MVQRAEGDPRSSFGWDVECAMLLMLVLLVSLLLRFLGGGAMKKGMRLRRSSKGRDGVKKTQREKKENLQRFSSHYVLRASLEGTSDPWDLELKKKVSFFYFFYFFLPGAEVDKDSSTCLLVDRAAKKNRLDIFLLEIFLSHLFRMTAPGGDEGDFCITLHSFFSLLCQILRKHDEVHHEFFVRILLPHRGVGARLDSRFLLLLL